MSVWLVRERTDPCRRQGGPSSSLVCTPAAYAVPRGERAVPPSLRDAGSRLDGRRCRCDPWPLGSQRPRARQGAVDREGIMSRGSAAPRSWSQSYSSPRRRSRHRRERRPCVSRGPVMRRSRGTRPGHYLALQVAGARRRNVTRKPRHNDLLDLAHAMHFPYVDVATAGCRERSPLVRSMLPKMTCPRQTVVVQNGHLDAVVAAVRAVGPPGARVGP